MRPLVVLLQTHPIFNGDTRDDNPNPSKYAKAAEFRAQQANAPPHQQAPYPSYFRNGEGLPLSTPGSIIRLGHGIEWVHHPLTPGQTTTWTPQSGAARGAIRSVYTDGAPTQFDVIYHYRGAGTSARGHGQFVLANYHAAAAPPPQEPPGQGQSSSTDNKS
ncbi:hypothetical protein GQX73_g4922 [Xylaria multiplex]|uniref:Uncharacterized protein n=1 Tax=Xylaria multiplex TaxID=323545 RepID=A0A7C8J1I6_9PEZI|nr:hypothetical protein GQX73_g4922 [Xylaria multiplex]